MDWGCQREEDPGGTRSPISYNEWHYRTQGTLLALTIRAAQIQMHATSKSKFLSRPDVRS